MLTSLLECYAIDWHFLCLVLGSVKNAVDHWQSTWFFGHMTVGTLEIGCGIGPGCWIVADLRRIGRTSVIRVPLLVNREVDFFDGFNSRNRWSKIHWFFLFFLLLFFSSCALNRNLSLRFSLLFIDWFLTQPFPYAQCGCRNILFVNWMQNGDDFFRKWLKKKTVKLEFLRRKWASGMAEFQKFTISIKWNGMTAIASEMINFDELEHVQLKCHATTKISISISFSMKSHYISIAIKSNYISIKNSKW